jgi:single-strand DNA-binding protein
MSKPQRFWQGQNFLAGMCLSWRDMNEIIVTVKGWVSTDPLKHTTEDGKDWASLRIASTPRFYSRKEMDWEDGQTEWIDGKIFKEPLALNALSSIKKGDPVVITGNLKTEEFVRRDGTTAKNLAVNIDSIGHNLSYGTSDFERSKMSVEIKTEE